MVKPGQPDTILIKIAACMRDGKEEVKVVNIIGFFNYLIEMIIKAANIDASV